MGRGECPVADALVEVRFRDGEQQKVHHPKHCAWIHNGEDGDIVAYRFLTPHDTPLAAALAEAAKERERADKAEALLHRIIERRGGLYVIGINEIRNTVRAHLQGGQDAG